MAVTNSDTDITVVVMDNITDPTFQNITANAAVVSFQLEGLDAQSQLTLNQPLSFDNSSFSSLQVSTITVTVEYQY